MCGNFFNGNNLFVLKLNKLNWICFGVFLWVKFIIRVCKVVDLLKFGELYKVVWFNLCKLKLKLICFCFVGIFIKLKGIESFCCFCYCVLKSGEIIFVVNGGN